jgi:ABC-2 type transport system ATP-binding protein
MPGTHSTLEIKNLSKRYSAMREHALKNLNLSVSEGEIYGFLGANGAGKSTAIHTLLNFIKPTSGSATVFGLDSVWDSVEIKRHVGYLPGEASLYKHMTGKRFLRYMAALQPPKHKNYVKQLAQRFDAPLDKPMHELSKGNRQKIAIIQAFMHEPDVLVLDEPTSGLDPLMQEEFAALVAERKAAGAAVFLSSHNFSEVQRMCDRVGFIREGTLAAEQTIAELTAKASHTFHLTFVGNAPLHELMNLENASVTHIDSHTVSISIQGELTPLFKTLARHHVTRLRQDEVNLEDEFMQYYHAKPEEITEEAPDSAGAQSHVIAKTASTTHKQTLRQRMGAKTVKHLDVISKKTPKPAPVQKHRHGGSH